MELFDNIEKPQHHKLISERIRQRSEDRLCEYLLGTPTNAPETLARIKDDKVIIRDKYNLPKNTENLRDYYNELLRIAKEDGISIVGRDIVERMGGNLNSVASAFPHIKTVSIDIRETDWLEFKEGLGSLMHEIMHIKQFRDYTRAPIEIKEYEAFVATIDDEDITTSGIHHLFMNMLLSIRSYYRQVQD